MKCAPCTDRAITSGTPATEVPEAFTMASVIQAFSSGGQQIAAPLVLPVCWDCRAEQLKPVSKSGLVTV